MHLIRTIFLWRDTAYQRLAIRNYSGELLALRLTMLFDSDFADLFEVRGLRRLRRGVARRSLIDPTAVAFDYEGLDLDTPTRGAKF